MDIARNGSQPSASGPAEYFTGAVRIDAPFKGSGPARVGGAIVTFEPGARTAWHTHPLGQTLIITSGCGWARHEGGPVEQIRPGDVVWFEPGEKHWHGAMPTTAMTHIAIAEALAAGAKAVDRADTGHHEIASPEGEHRCGKRRADARRHQPDRGRPVRHIGTGRSLPAAPPVPRRSSSIRRVFKLG